MPTGLVLVFVLMWLASKFSKSIEKQYQLLMGIKDKRIDFMADILKGMKSLKYLGWENIFLQKIAALRKREFYHLAKIKYLDAFCIVIWTVTSTTIVTVCLITFKLLGQTQFQTTNVFTVN